MSLTLSNGLIVTKIPNLSNNTEEQKQRCKEWIEALRSGKYVQGFGRLKEKLTLGKKVFCCLGVACDISINHGVGEWGVFWDREDGEQFKVSWGNYPIENVACSIGSLPDALVEYYGMLDEAGFSVVSNSMETFDFAQLNDQEKVSFSDIAIILETAITGGLDDEIVTATV